jgi:hypothetical protein
VTGWDAKGVTNPATGIPPTDVGDADVSTGMPSALTHALLASQAHVGRGPEIIQH